MSLKRQASNANAAPAPCHVLIMAIILHVKTCNNQKDSPAVARYGGPRVSRLRQQPPRHRQRGGSCHSTNVARFTIASDRRVAVAIDALKSLYTHQ